jgi:3'(2'), 5'-bisphosphate nucleotidase
MNDNELAAFLAAEAGKILLDLRNRGEFSGKELGKAGDAQANDMLVRKLTELRPDDGLLSEETADTPSRLTKSRVWIIDPLDGTREYSEGRDDWAVHVALAVDGKAHLGAVALPSLGLTLTSGTPSLLPPANTPPKMLVSRTRPAAEAVAVAQAIGAELLPMGSAGAKAMAVVRGEADIYLHTGGQYEWDNCAPIAVAEAAGLFTSRVDGSPMRYNAQNPYLPDLLICRPELVDQVMAALKAL